MYQQNQQGLYSDEHYLPNHGSPTRLFHNRFLPSFGPTEQKGKRRDLKIHSHPATHKSAGGGEASSKAMFHCKCNCTKPKNKASSFELLRYLFVSIASSSLLPPATIPSGSPGWVPHCVTFLHLHFSFSHRIPFILRHITSNHNVKPSSAPSHHSIPGNNIEPNLQLQHKINQYLWRHLQMQFRQKVLVSHRFKIFTQKAKNVRPPSDTKENILSSSSIYRNSHARHNKNS